MRLAEAKIRGFRKLVDTNCRFTGKLTAVVGPNEAGKSTLLELLMYGKNNDEIPATARPRGLAVDDEDEAFQLWYRLDEADKVALSHLISPDTPSWYVVNKLYDGNRKDWTEPQLRRDLAVRRRTRSALTRFAKTRAAVSLDRNEDEDGLGDLLDRVMLLVESEDELSTEDWSEVTELAEALLNEDISVSATQAATSLENWQEAESQEHPHDQARTILDAREPVFAAFDEPQRSLLSSYDLERETNAPSPALQNLADLAELDVGALHNAYVQDDPGAAETATDDANNKLRERLNVAWQQSDVEVHLRQDGDDLRLLVRTDAPRFSTVAERSEGLKTFVALTAFAHKLAQSDRPLVLLIDEAEQHLHYDAQADLVRMLDRQSVAQQVIYTTHSAGCLPTDLGTGVRAMVPLEGQGRSRVTNSLWQAGPGFTPLLMALGASAAAFAPSRYAVVGEGATEMLLLPSMIREAIAAERLDYQVAAGLSEVGNGALRDLELEAPRVAFVVDGDAGGAAHGRRLEKSGVGIDQIVHVGGQGSNLVIEDLLREEVLLRGLNEVLEQLGCSKRISRAALGSESVRANAIRKWCQRQQVPVPGKPAVAVAILDASEDRLLTAQGIKVLKQMHSSILAALKIPTHDGEPDS